MLQKIVPYLQRFAIGLALGAASGLVVKELDLPSWVSYWGPRVPITCAIALAFAVLFVTPLRAIVAGLSVALVGLWLAVAYTPLAPALTHHTLRADALPPKDGADAIFVFASSVQRDGDPTSISEARLLHGLELLGEGRAPRLIVSEAPRPDDGVEKIVRAWMQRLGVHGEVLAVGPAHSTHDEGLLLAALCKKNGWTRIIGVSSPVHGRRATAVLAHEGLTATFSPSVETRYDLDRFDYPDDRIKAFGDATHELIGYAVYKLRGWINSRSSLSPRIKSAAFSPIMIEGALVLPPVMVGMIEASATRSPSTPRTRSIGSTTASASAPIRHVPTG
jgi:uncharacterized SAM-binding protein YcdF (DUF218 family)